MDGRRWEADAIVAVVVLAAGALFTALSGQWWLPPIFVVAAFLLGRSTEMRWWMRAFERDRQRRFLESFTEWAEQTLAQAPDEPDGEDAELLSALRVAYQHAQATLERLR